MITTPNNNLNILPFYDSLTKQSHKKDEAFGEVFGLICPEKKFLPFQIIRETSASQLYSVQLFRKDGTLIADIFDDMISAGLCIKVKSGYDIIYYPGAFTIPTSTPEGQHYLRIQDESELVWYSEIFTIVQNTDDYLKIQYWEGLDFNIDDKVIDYSYPYRGTVYLKTQLGRPDYPISEVIEKRDEVNYVEKQISKKVYKFVFVAPEFLCDAMRIIRLHDHIRITNKGDIYDATSFLNTPKWLDGGYLAEVQAEFETATIIKKLGTTKLTTDTGDFDINYTNDFTI